MLNYGGEQNMTLLVLLVWKTTFFLVWKSPQIPRVDVSDSNWRKSIEFKEWRNQGYLSTLCGKLIHITPLLDISGLTLKERYATTLRETFWSGKALSLVHLLILLLYFLIWQILTGEQIILSLPFSHAPLATSEKQDSKHESVNFYWLALPPKRLKGTVATVLFLGVLSAIYKYIKKPT